MFAVVKQRAVNTDCVTFQNWALPNGINDAASLFFTEAVDDVFHNLHFTPAREYRVKLFIGRLKQTEGRVSCAVNNLDVLHGSVMRDPSDVRNVGGTGKAPSGSKV